MLRRKAPRGPTSYEWQYSTDGKTWISLTPNVQAMATIEGLTPGVTYFFRSRYTTKDGPTDWSQVIQLMVM